MSERSLVTPDTEFIKYLRKNGGDSLKKCFQCASCSVVCSLSPKDQAFPRKEMIYASWGQKEYLMADPDVWLCHGCTDCTAYCPRGAKPAEVMAAIRSYVVETHAVPKFMGPALRDPKYLPPLLMIPAAALLMIPLANLKGDFSKLKKGPVEYDRLFPELSVEVFFTAGNMLVFALAGVGLRNYWRRLNSGAGPADGKPPRLLPAFTPGRLEGRAAPPESADKAPTHRGAPARSFLSDFAKVLTASVAKLNSLAKDAAAGENGNKLKSAIKAGIDAFNEERNKNS